MLGAVSEQVEAAIRDEIQRQGPVTFARFMELALYGPGGFYDGTPVGANADFVTSPHVHPVFGELLGRGVRDLWEALERPQPLRLTEAGAGDGTLARQLLEALPDVPLAYTAVEVGRESRAALAELEGLDRIDVELTAPADVVLAHELLDNLPFRVLRGGREVRIRLDGDRLVEVLVEPDEALAPFVRSPQAAGDEVVDDERIVPVGAFAFVDRVASVLERGYALLIDYGGVDDAGGPLHGYRDQRIVEDVLASPGSADITAGVDFGLVAAHAEATGLTAFPTVTQHDALMALGFEAWFREELGRQHAQLDERDGLGAVRTWAGKSRATLLADPGGLGRFRWLLLATPGLPAPAWIQGPSPD